jgi:hypothetical protein
MREKSCAETVLSPITATPFVLLAGFFSLMDIAKLVSSAGRYLAYQALLQVNLQML